VTIARKPQRKPVLPPLRDFHIKKYPNSFLWNGLLARPYLEQAGSLLHKIGEIISWKSLNATVEKNLIS
jgi:hypothetical protein